MGKTVILGMILCLLLTGCGQAESGNAEDTEVMPELTGESISPDGRHFVQMLFPSGYGEDHGTSKFARLQLINTNQETVCWEGETCLAQSILWSPDGAYAALARTARTYSRVTVIDLEAGAAWEFALPNGGAIPEYTFLPEEWGDWLEQNTLLVTVGRGGDAGEQHTYRCSLQIEDGQLTGSVIEQATTVLSGNYDFTHDGQIESLELMDLSGQSGGWYELWVSQNGKRLWSQTLALFHAGWSTLLAVKLDGEDYLMTYTPWMGQGSAAYQYQIYSFNGSGSLVQGPFALVEFDINFGAPHHTGFDAAAITKFLTDASKLMEGSTLLVSTEGGRVRCGGSGDLFWKETGLWGNLGFIYDNSLTIEENVKLCETQLRSDQG